MKHSFKNVFSGIANNHDLLIVFITIAIPVIIAIIIFGHVDKY